MKEQPACYDARAIHARYRNIGFLHLYALVLLGLAGSAWGQNLPPPPRFISPPPGGTGACPYTVFLTDDQVGVGISFATSRNPRQTVYSPSTGIQVNASTTITATAFTIDPNTQSAPTAAQYNCGAFTSFILTIKTGNDDARTDSAITANANFNDGPSMGWCLKYSDQQPSVSCLKNSPGITWSPGTFNSFSLPVSQNDSSFTSLDITMATFPTGFGQSDDNWDLFSLSFTGITDASPGYPALAQLLNRQPLGAPCYARFQHPGGASNFGKPTTIRFSLDMTTPVMVPDNNGNLHPAPFCPGE